MGDYSKLIVSCTVKADIKKDLDEQIEQLGLMDSAYQSQEKIISIVPSTWKPNVLELIVIGQTKWGKGQDEFCDWLRPNVVQGSGVNEVYALSFSEYSDEPKVWKVSEGFTYE